jgi:hypothetical protein
VEKLRDWSGILAHIKSLLPFERTTLPAPGGQLEEFKPRISSHEHVLRWGLEENVVEDNARIRVLVPCHVIPQTISWYDALPRVSDLSSALHPETPREGQSQATTPIDSIIVSMISTKRMPVKSSIGRS